MNAAEVTLEKPLRRARIHPNEGNLIVAERIYLDIRTNPSSALQAKGEVSDAVEAWEAVLSQPTILANVANAYHEFARTADATAMRERAAAAGPNNASAHINVGNAYLDRGELEAAGRMYVRVTERDPRNNARPRDRGLRQSEAMLWS